MARIRTFDVTLGAGATQVTSTKTACLEATFTNVNTTAGHTCDIGGSDVATVPGIRLGIGATDKPASISIGLGHSGDKAFDLSDVYLKGTAADHIYVLAVTL